MSAKFTKRQRQELTHAFKLVKKNLRAQHASLRYICLVLDSLWARGEINKRVSDMAQLKVIHSRLDGWSSLERWLRHKGVEMDMLRVRLGHFAVNEMLCTHRKQWLDLLIAEFSEDRGMKAYPINYRVTFIPTGVYVDVNALDGKLALRLGVALLGDAEDDELEVRALPFADPPKRPVQADAEISRFGD